MQSTLDYATIIFGSKDEARRLYVEELKMLLTKDSLAVHIIDEHLKVGPGVPQIHTLLGDYRLFTHDFHQALIRLSFDVDRMPALTGELLTGKIQDYLRSERILLKVLDEFRSQCKVVHVSVYPGGVEKEIKDFIAGIYRPKGGINSVTPFQYAEIHISTSILRSL